MHAFAQGSMDGGSKEGAASSTLCSRAEPSRPALWLPETAHACTAAGGGAAWGGGPRPAAPRGPAVGAWHRGVGGRGHQSHAGAAVEDWEVGAGAVGPSNLAACRQPGWASRQVPWGCGAALGMRGGGAATSADGAAPSCQLLSPRKGGWRGRTWSKVSGHYGAPAAACTPGPSTGAPRGWVLLFCSRARRWEGTAPAAACWQQARERAKTTRAGHLMAAPGGLCSGMELWRVAV